MAIPTDGDNKQWLIQEYQSQFGRNPTRAELDGDAHSLATGASRQDIADWIAHNHAEERVRYLYKTYYHRDPTQQELANSMTPVLNRNEHPLAMTDRFAQSDEALLYKAPAAGANTASQNDARTIINGQLDQIGLPQLKAWAWGEIQSGHSNAQVMLDLRDQQAYKNRFAGLIANQHNGGPPMTEGDYLRYEADIRQRGRTAGLPASFWSSQQEIAELAAKGISADEFSQRIGANGYGRVNNAPDAVRQAFGQIFGTNGDQALAAFFLDSKKALPILEQMATAAEDQGYGAAFGLNLAGTPGHTTGPLAAAGRAGDLAQAGISGAQAQQGFSRLAQLRPVFNELVGEHQDLTAENQGVNAIFGLGDPNVLEQRLKDRTASFKGGGGSVLANTGLQAGAAH